VILNRLSELSRRVVTFIMFEAVKLQRFTMKTSIVCNTSFLFVKHSNTTLSHSWHVSCCTLLELVGRSHQSEEASSQAPACRP
jgi:hypothetical protein